ncbi:MAG: SUMF1/EgtB/PvdO family nonheme iron enzyme [Candidatus Omnitrophota bacterium]
MWEWCSDWYKEGYPTASQIDPEGPGSGNYRVLRGGGWFGDAGGCRSASRGWGDPGGRNDFLGFRCARTP